MSGILVVNYTEYSIALFSSKEWRLNYKNELIELGGKYNQNLTWEGEKRKGWIFEKKREDEIQKFVSKHLIMEKIYKYIETETDINKLNKLLQITSDKIKEFQKMQKTILEKTI